MLAATYATDILTGGAAGAAGIAAGAEVEVSIAMYGDDFYDPSTVPRGTYNPVKIRVACAKGYAGTRCQYSDAVTCGGAGAATDAGACSCFAGFAGVSCQFNSTSLCNGPEGGASTDQGMCECKRGYAGDGYGYSSSTVYHNYTPRSFVRLTLFVLYAVFFFYHRFSSLSLFVDGRKFRALV